MRTPATHSTRSGYALACRVGVQLLLRFVASSLLLGVGVLAAPIRDTSKAGDESEVTIGELDGKKMKMVLCRIPAGKAVLGSPATEADRRANEAEHEFVTQGFWMGKYEVTQ